MGKVHFSPREVTVLKAMSALQARGKRRFHPEDIVDDVMPPGLLRPEHWRSSINGSLRALTWKLATQGIILQRKSGLGRGSRAEYEFFGDLTKLISKKEKVS